MVNLKVKSYSLDEESIGWVEDTINSMSIEEKIGQLFVSTGASRDEEYLKSILDSYHIGTVRYDPGKAEEVYEQDRILQENSKIPLLIAVNTEMGGDGACTDGTYVGNEAKIAATQDSHYAYELGRISGAEASVIGCNWSFTPIVDINRDWRNPIISIRTWSADVEQTLELSLQYMKGITGSRILPTAKHSLGGGIDKRDQHLSFAPNTLTAEEWDNTFGKVYSGLIEVGLPSIMAGHIVLSQYVKKFNPEATIQEMNMPATLSKYVLTDLLEGQIGFDGLVVADAFHMAAMTSATKRKDMLPIAIVAGNDLFLFFNDPDEDFQRMMEGYKNGVIIEERLNDALSRILGLKVFLGLHKEVKTEILQPKEEAMVKIGLEKNKKAALEIADEGITLVKNNQEIFPISADKTKKVLLVNAKGFEGGFGKFISLTRGVQKGPIDIMKELLVEEGLEVEIHEPSIDKIMKLPKEEMGAALGNVYAGKCPMAELTPKYDLIINIADVGASVGQCLQWPPSKDTPDIPFYVNEIPTIFVSAQCPSHLADVPQTKTYMNTYNNKDYTLKVLVDKMVGRSEFKGVSPVDAFYGLEDTRY